MKYFYALFFLLSATFSFAQIRGTVTDAKGLPLPLVSVLVQGTYNGTSTNEQGEYELNIKKPGTYTLIFQFLGFKTKKITVQANAFPLVQNVSLADESLSLNEVVINTKENPALAIIRKAIAAKKENSEKTARFKADFYSRGIFKVKDVPKKIMGQKIEDPDGSLDSTGSGIIYLSETVSKITFEKPDNLKEHIIASKVSGDSKGYSYNTAVATQFDFYNNTIDFNIKMISPIADNAFNYYKYKLEGTFNDDDGQMINKIKVSAKRDAEPVFEGYIYIVEDSWAIYAVDLDIKGYRMNQQLLDHLKLVQNFSYNKQTNIWAKTTQSLEFAAGFFGIKFGGKFSYVYSNYEFFDQFEKKTFGSEVVSFEANSNKKDSIYWNVNRPIPLTDEETRDYTRKDSLYLKRHSPTYLDSVDRKHNRFKIFDILSGYSYQNSQKHTNFTYDGLLKLTSLSFNTVQGWNFDSGFSYSKTGEDDDKGRYTSVATKFNYGFADERFRASANFYHRFNRQNYAFVNVFGGTAVSQYNPENPISKLVNSVSTLFFKDNYMKLYNKEFLGISYGRSVANGLNLNAKIEYQQRKALVNHTDYVLISQDDLYTSNNPLLPLDDAPAFETHHLTKLSLGGRFVFGNKYISRPDGKVNIPNHKYPALYLNYETALAASDKKYEYQHLSARVFYDFSLSNKGEMAVNLKAGKFFHGDNISFIDYKHFNGNQTHIADGSRYTNAFGLLPYYTNSTNDAYLETHVEYDDNGYIINKIPLLNLLKTNLMVGFHNISVPQRSPYSEFSVGLNNLGFGKFRLFRVDYVRSYQNGFVGDGVVFGLKFLNVLD